MTRAAALAIALLASTPAIPANLAEQWSRQTCPGHVAPYPWFVRACTKWIAGAYRKAGNPYTDAEFDEVCGRWYRHRHPKVQQ
jgi:hypothetical protein